MMEGYQKYKRQYFLPPKPCMDWAEKEYIEKIGRSTAVVQCGFAGWQSGIDHTDESG